MAKIMLYDGEARAALARGVEKLSRAVVGTLGPKGTNAIIDRPIGTPLVSRDGVSIAAEIELPCRFENLGAQVVREVSAQMGAAVADVAYQRGLAAGPPPNDTIGYIQSQMYDPHY